MKPKLVLVPLAFFILAMSIPIALSQTININANLTLLSPTCSDSTQNQNETGIDCGGPCPSCPSCTDGVQNQDETGVDCGGVCSSCSSSGSSGSSGSGGVSGVPFASPKTNKSSGSNSGPFSKNFLLIRKDERISAEINYTDLSVYELSIKIKNQLNNMTLEVKNQDSELPFEKPNISRHLFQFFKIEAKNFDTSDIDSVNLLFKIPKEWIESQNTSFEEFILLHYKDKWFQIKTDFFYQDDKSYHFFAETNSLGYFAIAGIETKKSAALSAQEKDPFKLILEQPAVLLSDGIGKEAMKNLSLITGAIFIILLSVVLIIKKIAHVEVVMPKVRVNKDHEARIEEMHERLNDYQKRMSEIDEKLRNL